MNHGTLQLQPVTSSSLHSRRTEASSRLDTISARKCARCRISFKSGEVHVKVENTVWHKDCFRCAQCFCSLYDRTYFMEGGRCFCQHDFEVLYAPICHNCQNYISGSVIRAPNGSFHTECFLCDECNGDLEDGMWLHEGNMLCHSCKEEKRKIPSYVCVKCRQLIDKSELLKVNNDFFHAYHFDCKKCGDTLTSSARFIRTDKFCPRCYDLQCEICAACKKAIDPQVERSRFAMNKHWHTDHFCCAKCGLPFRDEEFFTRNGNAYCPIDYVELFGEYCFECQKGLSGESIRIFEKGWCKDCYKCRGCRRHLNAKDKVVEEDMLPLCKKCVSQKIYKKIVENRLLEKKEKEKATKKLSKLRTSKESI